MFNPSSIYASCWYWPWPVFHSFRPTHKTNSANLGLFTDDTDIGTPRHAGSAQYDPAQQTYTVGGGGVNMWFTNDGCHMVWKKVSGDVTLAANISFVGTSKEPHRKACLIIRQNLDADSPYVDAVLHGNGLTALQCRDAKGGQTLEVQSNVNGPRRLRVEKHGKYISMSIAREGEALHPAGGSYRLDLEEPFYVGLAVSAHNNNAFETAAFSNVELVETTPHRNQQRPAPHLHAGNHAGCFPGPQ